MGEYEPCGEWPVDWSCDVSDQPTTKLTKAAKFATTVLWALTGRQFGVCSVTLRPCRADCDTSWQGWAPWPANQWISPALVAGQWFNIVCGKCSGTCTCTALSSVLLPQPVDHITEVKVDGEPLPETAYRLYDRHVLYRTDGGDWPRCNNLAQPDTEPGTWSITAGYGVPVPDTAGPAIGELACQALQALDGDDDCRLPKGVQQLVRQGVTIQFPDVTDLFTKGITGLYLTDAFIAAVNPYRLAEPARVYSIDRAYHSRET